MWKERKILRNKERRRIQRKKKDNQNTKEFREKNTKGEKFYIERKKAKTEK